jgi:hypothetical protein
VDPVRAAVDWTLSRALRTTRFWWIATGYLCGMFAWYAVQVHQTRDLVETGVNPTGAAWALGPWITGVVYDSARSYAAVFWLAMGASVLSAIAIWRAAPREVRAVAGRVQRA